MGAWKLETMWIALGTVIWSFLRSSFTIFTGHLHRQLPTVLRPGVLISRDRCIIQDGWAACLSLVVAEGQLWKSRWKSRPYTSIIETFSGRTMSAKGHGECKDLQIDSLNYSCPILSGKCTQFKDKNHRASAGYSINSRTKMLCEMSSKCSLMRKSAIAKWQKPK